MEARALAWIRAMRDEGSKHTPLVVGLQGVQGAGKSTLADALVRRLEAEGVGACRLSLDDFYLPSADLAALAARHPADARLHGRGCPGTHDLEALLAAVRRLKAGAEVVAVPVFDKGLRGGEGDRAPCQRVLAAPGGFDVVLVEGWCLGFAPRGDAGDAVDAHVAAYAALTAELDALCLLPGTAEDACTWRREAEKAQGLEGRGAMGDAEFAAFFARHAPLYAAYLPALRAAPPVARALRLPTE